MHEGRLSTSVTPRPSRRRAPSTRPSCCSQGAAPWESSDAEGAQVASHWRKGYRRKNGAWVKPHRVGSNPSQGCSFWLLGVLTLAAGVAVLLKG
jgi:hypothetical protein